MSHLFCECPRPKVYPFPRRMESLAGEFVLDEEVRLLLPERPSDQDLFLARFFAAELTDRYQVAIHMESAVEIPRDGRSVLIGSIDGPLVKQACPAALTASLGAEGYILHVSEQRIVVAGADDAGSCYGLQSLRQLMEEKDGALRVPCTSIEDWPYKPFRGLRLYLPGRDQFPFFKRFIRDFACFFKYNRLILEMNAAMRLDRHPELNAGWYEFAKCMNYTRRSRPEGPGNQFQDSAHHECGNFGVIEKDEVAELVSFAERHHLEVIPEIPSLTHSYYLLTRHRELAEIQAAEWPDTYCPLDERSYELYFDVLDEYIEVMHPKTIHIGHDEWRMPMHICPKCKGKDYRELFVKDVRVIHDCLASKGVRVAMWGDHLLESVRGVKERPNESRTGYEYRMPSGITRKQLEEEVPRDILILNWFWNSASREGADQNDKLLSDLGFEQLFGNFSPAMAEQNYGERSSQPGVVGGAPSSWILNEESYVGKDLMYAFVGCAQLLWSDTWQTGDELTATVQSLMPTIRRHLRHFPSPSADGEPVTALDLSSYCTASSAELPDIKIAVVGGTQGGGGSGLPIVSPAIPIGEDPSSLIFYHACAKPASNRAGHFTVYNLDDSADLLGWYEVVYEDGFVETVPIRYGVNILESSWGREREVGALCYEADPVNYAEAGERSITFFAYEWTNPRFGKAIRELRLKGTTGCESARGGLVEDNTTMLAGMAIVKARPAPESVYGREDI